MQIFHVTRARKVGSEISELAFFKVTCFAYCSIKPSKGKGQHPKFTRYIRRQMVRIPTSGWMGLG